MSEPIGDFKIRRMHQLELSNKLRLPRLAPATNSDMSPTNDTISAFTIMLKSTGNRYLPYIVSIESGGLVLSEKQGLAYFFYSLDKFCIQSIDTEDQITKMKMFSATLRLSASSHLTLCFISYSQMRATLSAIHCA